MDRAEHMAWCKRRALDELEAGDPSNAVASMMSDLRKHDDTAGSAAAPLMMLGPQAAGRGDSRAVREWIEGFN